MYYDPNMGSGTDPNALDTLEMVASPFTLEHALNQRTTQSS